MSTRKGQKKRASLVTKHQNGISGTVLVILALPEERDYFHGQVADRPRWSGARHPRSRYALDYQSDYGEVQVVVHTLESMGNVEASLGASAAITALNPDLVLLVGLAGSLQPNFVQLGDVVISNQAKLYDSDKVMAIQSRQSERRIYRFDNDPMRNGEDIVVDHRDAIMSGSFLRYQRKIIECTRVDTLIDDIVRSIASDIARLRRIAGEHVPAPYRVAHESRREVQLHSGWLLASSLVVDSAEYRDYLVEKNVHLNLDVHRQVGELSRSDWRNGELLAIDMESYGVLRAVQHFTSFPAYEGGVPNLFGAIIVRGISDLCEEKVSTDSGSAGVTRQIAVENATEVAVWIIESIDYAALKDK